MPSSPQSAIACNRRAWRLRPGHAEEAFVHFDLEGGAHWKLSLSEISAGGVGFVLENDRPELPVGARIDGATVQVGGLRFMGSLRVTRVTPEFAVGTVCGAEFTPATDADRRMMNLLISALEKRSLRGVDSSAPRRF